MPKKTEQLSHEPDMNNEIILKKRAVNFESSLAGYLAIVQLAENMLCRTSVPYPYYIFHVDWIENKTHIDK